MFLAFTVSLIVVLFLLLVALSRDAGEAVHASRSEAVAGRVYVLNVTGPALFVVPSDRRDTSAPLQIDYDLNERPRALKAIAGGNRGARGQSPAVLTVVREYEREA